MVLNALKKSFSRPRDWIAFVLAAGAIFALFVLIPVWTTPGDDLAFQVSLLSPSTIAAMVILSMTNALLICMQREIRRMKAKTGAREAASGAALLAGSVFATLGCASCYSSLLSVFGLGGVIFFGTYHLWILGSVIALSLYAVWATARRIERVCTSEACKI